MDGAMSWMTPAQAASLASGVAVLLCFAYECRIDGKWGKSPTAGAALATVLAVLFSILFAGGRETSSPTPAPPAAPVASTP
jgi:hypothetical protein